MSFRVKIWATSLVLSFSLAACSRHEPTPPPAAAVANGSAQKLAVGQTAHCPVTHEEFVVKADTVQIEHAGKHYAFCCADCAPSFTKNPAKFADKN